MASDRAAFHRKFVPGILASDGRDGNLTVVLSECLIRIEKRANDLEAPPPFFPLQLRGPREGAAVRLPSRHTPLALPEALEIGAFKVVLKHPELGTDTVARSPSSSYPARARWRSPMTRV
jgi:hypothetical protein